VIATGRRGSSSAAPNGSNRTKTKKRARGVIKADINVTPLVDVVLVLLIIFMVVTPMLSKGVNVDLPVTEHHDKRSDDNRDIVVAVTNRAEIYVGGDRVAVEKLADAVAAERRRHPDKGIFLKGDARLDYGQARRVMEALHRGGIDQVQIGTEEAHPQSSSAQPGSDEPGSHESGSESGQKARP
jgi:biopolymer transport protein TolR